MKVLDLFSGLGGWSNPFKEAGHEVRTLDYDPKFGATYPIDIRAFAADPDAYLNGWRPDIILASPDCRGFSVASIGKMWHEGTTRPKHATSAMGLQLLAATFQVIEKLTPAAYVIENPRGMMTNVLREWYGLEPAAITYCAYGKTYQKPSRLWFDGLPDLKLHEACTGHPRNGHYTDQTGTVWVLNETGKPCHHKAERGAKTGIQGIKDPAERALVPVDLAKQVLTASGTAGGAKPLHRLPKQETFVIEAKGEGR